MALDDNSPSKDDQNVRETHKNCEKAGTLAKREIDRYL